jgi:hypothetical protein
MRRKDVRGHVRPDRRPRGTTSDVAEQILGAVQGLIWLARTCLLREAPELG